MVITFDRHPRELLCADWHPRLLTSLQEKERLLAQTGVDWLVVLPFDRRMALLSAYDFMHQVLGKQLGVRLLLTGYDNRFGHDRSEGFEDYLHYGQTLGMDVLAAQPLTVNGQTVCSSLIRQLLHDGRISEANKFLGRPYSLQGTVVHGEQIGRHLGFPTANLQTDDAQQLMPANGVYAVRCWSQHPGMMNIGMRPTFDGQQRTAEIHLFDFADNIYGQPLTVDFIERLRDERHFENAEALKRQMQEDALRTKEILNT